MVFRIGSLVIAIGESGAKDTDRSFSCERKVKYNTEATALKVADHMTEKKNETIEAYKCRHCDGWHVGHAF